jgi:hypothetical protein
MTARTILAWLAIAGLAVTLLLLFNFWAPAQLASMAVYTGLVLTLAGGLCALFPFRFLGVQKRHTGGAVLLAGLLVIAGALIWPAPRVQVQARSTQLDEFMPDYHFYERHTVRIHAPMAKVMAAIQQTTSMELPASVGLMRVRGAVMRQKIEESDAMRQMSILDELTAPGSGFVVLHRNDREIVLGMAGQPWKGLDGPRITGTRQYAEFREPGSVKVAVNLRVDNAGDGCSLVTTETRVLGIDDSGRRTMARYWRFIVPGSGLIRRQWLDAIRNRAEGRYRPPAGSSTQD